MPARSFDSCAGATSRHRRKLNIYLCLTLSKHHANTPNYRKLKNNIFIALSAKRVSIGLMNKNKVRRTEAEVAAMEQEATLNDFPLVTDSRTVASVDYSNPSGGRWVDDGNGDEVFVPNKDASEWRNNGRIQGRTNQIEIIRKDYSWQGRNVIIVKGEDCEAIAEKIMAALSV